MKEKPKHYITSNIFETEFTDIVSFHTLNHQLSTTNSTGKKNKI